MAKIEYGPIAAQVSGSMGGTTFSRNRYGTYFRSKAIPVNPNTAYQQLVRANLAARSQEWRGLTQDQRMAWNTWAQSNPFIDRLGNSQVLQPNAAYVRLNALLAMSGNSVITDPPVGDAPLALATMSFAPNATAGTCVVTFTATPLGATEQLIINVAVCNSSGITYVKNLYKLTEFGAAETASLIDIIDGIEERFGTLLVGQSVHLSCQVLDNATGLVSAPVTDSALAV